MASTSACGYPISAVSCVLLLNPVVEAQPLRDQAFAAKRTQAPPHQRVGTSRAACETPCEVDACEAK